MLERTGGRGAAIALALLTLVLAVAARPNLDGFVDDIRRPVYRGNLRYKPELAGLPSNASITVVTQEKTNDTGSQSRSWTDKQDVVDTSEGNNGTNIDVSSRQHDQNDELVPDTQSVPNSTEGQDSIKNRLTALVNSVKEWLSRKANRTEGDTNRRSSLEDGPLWSLVSLKQSTAKPELDSNILNEELVQSFVSSNIKHLQEPKFGEHQSGIVIDKITNPESLDNLILSHTQGHKPIQLVPHDRPANWTNKPIDSSVITIADVHPSLLPKPEGQPQGGSSIITTTHRPWTSVKPGTLRPLTTLRPRPTTQPASKPTHLKPRDPPRKPSRPKPQKPSRPKPPSSHKPAHSRPKPKPVRPTTQPPTNPKPQDPAWDPHPTYVVIPTVVQSTPRPKPQKKPSYGITVKPTVEVQVTTSVRPTYVYPKPASDSVWEETKPTYLYPTIKPESVYRPVPTVSPGQHWQSVPEPTQVYKPITVGPKPQLTTPTPDPWPQDPWDEKDPWPEEPNRPVYRPIYVQYPTQKPYAPYKPVYHHPSHDYPVTAKPALGATLIFTQATPTLMPPTPAPSLKPPPTIVVIGPADEHPEPNVYSPAILVTPADVIYPADGDKQTLPLPTLPSLPIPIIGPLLDSIGGLLVPPNNTAPTPPPTDCGNISLLNNISFRQSVINSGVECSDINVLIHTGGNKKPAGTIIEADQVLEPAEAVEVIPASPVAAVTAKPKPKPTTSKPSSSSGMTVFDWLYSMFGSLTFLSPLGTAFLYFVLSPLSFVLLGALSVAALLFPWAVSRYWLGVRRRRRRSLDVAPMKPIFHPSTLLFERNLKLGLLKDYPANLLK